MLFWCMAGYVLGPLSANAQTYSIVDLGTLEGGGNSFSTGINNAGQVVGWAHTDPSNLIWHATLWSEGTLTDLGTLGGKLSSATGINDAGMISGNSEDLTGYRPVTWNGTTQTELATPPGANSVANGINNAGQVVGSTGALATIWNGTTPTYLYGPPQVGGISPASAGNGINNRGEVVGSSTISGYLPYGDGAAATVWNGTTPTQLGTVGSGGQGGASGINDMGQVVGANTMGSTSASHATLWNGTTPTDLGVLGGVISSANAINNSGEVTGMSQPPTNLVVIDTIAFLYSNGRMTDLNALIDPKDPLNQTLVLSRGNGINDSGWIAADGVSVSTGITHAYLIVPVSFLPRTLTFASQKVGAQSAAQPVTITNTGAHPFTVSSISASADFSQLNNCPISLPVGMTCTIQVTFSPVTSGAQSGLLHIKSGSAILTVAMSGSAFIPIALKGSATSVTVGMPIILTWASTSLAKCTATGGATGDGWAGNIASSGSKLVSEPSSGRFTYTVQCAVAGASVQQQVVVTNTSPPSSGGGALDYGSLVALIGMIGFHYRRSTSVWNRRSRLHI
jgi:probable HAF family extracellular repeat protein